MDTLKKTAMWTGIVVTGLLGVVLLGGGKVSSGTLLVITAFVMSLPFWRHRLPLWVRIVLICAVFALVISNISTTDLPVASAGMMTCSELAYTPTPTGFKFLDQVNYIFSSFLAQAAPS
jgi:ribose/xylose/arabinose/galactoside ABC-type transport system permease subunit